MVPDLLLFNAAQFSIDRRGQDIRYFLPAPLPLAFRRAEVSALNVQSPGWYHFFAQLVGTRRSHSKAIALKFQQHQGLRPGAISETILIFAPN